MATFSYPTAAELRGIEPIKLPRLMANRPIFDLLPIREVDYDLMIWEQNDLTGGLQQARGLDGAPPRVKRPGLKSYAEKPGVYGEQFVISESELTRRRELGTFNTPINISDLVMAGQDQLLERRLNRIEATGWTTIATGTFTATGPTGSVLHTISYTFQTYSAGVAWSTSATSTPLADFRAVQLKSRGFSVAFNQKAVAYMNQTTFNSLMSNTNSSDLFGRRLGLGTINDQEDVNRVLLSDNLPQIQIYDEGYFAGDDGTSYTLFIPNNKVIVVGVRPSGTPLGEYQMTRNANNPGMAPGPYTRVFDRGDDGVPRSLEVHDGHNGGPAIMFPSSVVVMSV